MRSVVLTFVALIALVVASGRAHADILKSSPGELAKSHADLDSQDKCTTCHEPDNTVSANKCLSCHDHQNMKKKIDAGEGFHASAKVKGRDCKLCHQEHRGRGFDLMGWAGVGGENAFDHKLTTFPLNGKHSATTCVKCHTTTNRQGLRTFLGTEKLCGSCHAKEQPHGQVRALVMQCGRCHTETQWKPQKSTLDFDHNDKKQAAMSLEGTHADVACSKCHAKAAFKLGRPGDTCEQCHKSPHDGQLFSTKACSLCHSPVLKSLREVQFDHKKNTGYPLVAKHATLTCETCHTKALALKKPNGACESCHQKDNKHGTRFSKFPACGTCHTQRSWTANFQFNHATNTAFPLTAKHATVSCRACHRGSTPDDYERFEIKNGCMSCHQHKKAHGGQYKENQCLTCHKEAGSPEIRREQAIEQYHGSRSKFPLVNAHATVKCEMCHINDVYQNTPRECGVTCHEDSLHKGTLGQECSRCHEPGQWPAVRFDHKDDTKWPLKGKHAEINTCESCHPGRVYHDTPTTCASSGCHKKDDVHQGQLGDACERCHDESGAVLFKHNRDSKFKIDGGHVPLVCGACHKTVAFKPVRSDCFGCHPEPAIHKGRYGTECERCHSTASFGDIKAQHDVGDFSLQGAHDQLACASCHPHGEKLRGSGNLCVTCHRKDDIHQGSLSPRCGECHTQRAFAPARFDHLSVGCSLMGLHSTLPCAECHRNGNFGAVSPMCVSCHRNDALQVAQPDHRSSGYFDCGSCHNPTAWLPARTKPLGRETVCR